MAKADLANLLARTDVFASLSDADREQLAAQCALRKLAKDEQLFTRGDAGDALYIVAAGSIALTASTVSGRDIVLRIATPPESFGELAILDEGPRVATATARERTVLLRVPGPIVQTLFVSRPPVAAALMKSLAIMTRQVHEHALDLVTLDLPGRVAKQLLIMSGVDATTAKPGSVAVNFRLNQSEIAQLVGGSRQHVNRVIVTLEQEGAITRQGPRIVAVRPDLLAAATEQGVR